ncbi:trypco2 family protein [Streptomyces collinus]|uniref:trypco2 family protein n=1 Tax=Streptomyces collinus TaxID=42684 RepID=UPI00368ACA2B
MGIPLAKALAELRRELYVAQAEGSREQFRFEVEQAELTLEVEFRSDGNGGVKVEVGALGTTAAMDIGGGLGSTRRQVLTLTLQVRDEALGGERARIRRGSGGLDTDGGSSESTPGTGESDSGGDVTGTDGDGTSARPWES